MRTRSLKIAAAAASLAVCLSAAWLPAQRPASKTTVRITTMEAVKFLYKRGQYKKAEKAAYIALWTDIRQPEALYYLAVALEKQKRPDEAAAYIKFFDRVLDEPQFAKDKRGKQQKQWCATKLKVLDADFRKDEAKYLASAKGKRFTSPEKVDDLWMTQVRADLHPLWHLYAWKLVGGRKDASEDWIHNRQGVMHRSGAKYIDDVHGRKGILYTIPQRKSKGDAKIVTRNVGKCKLLRMGVRGYGFSLLVNVVVEKKKLFSLTVPTAWRDLKIPLEGFAGKDLEVTIELIVPEKQRSSEGVFFDYIDFFED